MPILGPENDHEVRLKQLELEIQALRRQPQLIVPVPYWSNDATVFTPNIIVTSGTFIDTWQTTLKTISHPGMYVQFEWLTGVGTTGEIALRVGSNTSSVVSCGAATSGLTTFAFLHGVDLWSTDSNASIRARKTGGVNTFQIYQPRGGFILVGADGCTTTGL